jgi:UDP-N-acetylglucosamine--N-acetylmuramyl-(pentapeptide) pyrophosphoryl-undecaprenol N-acetylglucosamine transferase
MRVLLSGGGTGGHVYPGLAVAAALIGTGADPGQQADRPEDRESVSLLWVGSVDGLEGDLVRRGGVPFRGIVAGGVHGLSLKRMAINAAKMARGLGQAWQVIGEFRPHVCFVTGGYVSVPVALAAWMRRVPVLVYLPDIEPGQAVRFISRFARRVAVTAEDSRAYFPSRKVVVTGYPIRPELRTVDRDAARERLGLCSDLPVLLVMGGSRGARPINRALTAALEELLPACEIIHISGYLDADWVAQCEDTLPLELRRRYHSHAYLHSQEMAQAMAAADLVVARAGAATMAEFPVMGLASVLVPYPHYWRYQKVNADYMVRRGAAIQLEDEQLATDLVPTVRRLLGDGAARRAAGQRARALARPEAARHIARELLQLGTAGAVQP